MDENLNIPELFFQSTESEWVVKQQKWQTNHKKWSRNRVLYSKSNLILGQNCIPSRPCSRRTQIWFVFQIWTAGPNWHFARYENEIYLFRQCRQCLLQLQRLWQSWRRCQHDAKIGASSTEEISFKVNINVDYDFSKHECSLVYKIKEKKKKIFDACGNKA